MLVRYLPEQVAEHWDALAPYIADALPPVTSLTREGMTNILRSLMFDDLKLWIYFDTEEEGSPAIGIVTTITQVDRVVLQRNLLIYTITAIRPIEPRHWRKGLETLRKFAKAQDCEYIISYVNDDRMKRIAQDLGANVEYTLTRLEV